jgi:hypothetical protein
MSNSANHTIYFQQNNFNDHIMSLNISNSPLGILNISDSHLDFQLSWLIKDKYSFHLVELNLY